MLMRQFTVDVIDTDMKFRTLREDHACSARQSVSVDTKHVVKLLLAFKKKTADFCMLAFFKDRWLSSMTKLLRLCPTLFSASFKKNAVILRSFGYF